MKRRINLSKNSGITLVTLIITIVVLLILAGIATFSGIEAIENGEYTRFKSELKIMQTYVNRWYDELQPKEGENFDDNITEKFTAENIGATNAEGDSTAETALSAVGISSTSYENYYILDETQLNALGVEGVTQDVLVSVKDRKVVSYRGINYKGDKYYTADDFYNVDYDEQLGEPNSDFSVKYDNSRQGKTTVTVYNITNESGYNQKWKVGYKKDGESTWHISDNLSFTVTEDGDYKVRLLSQSEEVVGSEQTIFVSTIKYENSTLDGETDKTKMNSKNPVIPKGFKAVNINWEADSFEGDSTAKWKYVVDENEETIVEGWNDGLVIEDQLGNQFVWVPCTMDANNNVATSGIVSYAKKFDGYPSSYSATSSNTSDATDSDGGYSAIPVTETTQIANYGGFYVARFEAGLATARSNSSNNTVGTPLSKKGTRVWNNVDYNTSYKSANSMINNSTKYGNNKSGLITGTQWDTIMQWYEKNNIPVLASNQNWGTYKDLTYTINGDYFTYTGTWSEWQTSVGNLEHTENSGTASSENPRLYHASGLNSDGYKKNIADLGGNLWELTAEKYSSYCVFRGANESDNVSSFPVSYRIYNTTEFSIQYLRFPCSPIHSRLI